MRQVLSGQSGQSGSQWAGRGCHSELGGSVTGGCQQRLTSPGAGHLCHTCHTAAGHTRDTRDKDVVT